VGAWGFICPQLEDTSTGDILEYCLQEWRGEHNASKWQEERVAECASVEGHAKDLVTSFFWPGTQFATERSGSANTYVWQGAGGHHFEAAITKSDLVAAIDRDRTEYVQGERSGEPATGKGCGRSLSTNPENYALIGVSQGNEGWRELTALAGNSANLQLRTEYTPLPPEASTDAASEVQVTQAKLNGSVNPKGTATKYYFQYGTTTSYGKTTSENGAGSGQGSVDESATVTGLKPGTTYHYRLVAHSEGGTSEGKDETVTTPPLTQPAAVRESSNGEQWVYDTGTSISGRVWTGSVWDPFEAGTGEAPAPDTSPTVVRDASTGDQWGNRSVGRRSAEERHWIATCVGADRVCEVGE